MVSSFHIQTNIRVSPSIAKSFNQWVEELCAQKDPFPEYVTIPAYHDTGYMGDVGVELFDKFVASQDKWGCTLDSQFSTNWRFDSKGVLYDCCEKFHGAVSALDYYIQTYFAPRGIMLNGSVIGVNTEMPVCYVYHVHNNRIVLDVELTREMIETYEETEKLCEAEDDCFDSAEIINAFQSEAEGRHRLFASAAVPASAPADMPEPNEKALVDANPSE